MHSLLDFYTMYVFGSETEQENTFLKQQKEKRKMRKETETLTQAAVEALSLQDKLRVLIELLDESYIQACSKSELAEVWEKNKNSRIKPHPQDEVNIALDALLLEKAVTAHIVEVVTSDTGVFYKGSK